MPREPPPVPEEALTAGGGAVEGGGMDSEMNLSIFQVTSSRSRLHLTIPS